MRFYTQEESVELSRIFNEELFAEEYYTVIQLSSPITSDDFLSTNTMKFSEFKKKYSLNVNDAYEELASRIGNEEEEGGIPFSKEFNVNVQDNEDLRYPIIILCNNVEGDNVPDLIHYTELLYTVEHFDDEDLEIIVIDKMNKPFDRELLNRVGDFYGIDNYDYSLYS